MIGREGGRVGGGCEMGGKGERVSGKRDGQIVGRGMYQL